MTANQIASLLTLLAVAAGGALMGFTLFDALKSGEFPHRGGAVERKRQPFAFWAEMAYRAFLFLMVLAIGVYALWRLTASNAQGAITSL